MMNLALRNYIRAFKWQNIKEKFHNGGWFSLFYVMIMLPVLLSGYDVKSNTSILCLLIMLPNIFAMTTAILFPAILPKMMYLCPMSKEMRKDYLIKAALIRTTVPILLSILVILIMLFNGLTDGMSAFGILLNNTIFAIFLGAGININGYGKIAENGLRSLEIENSFSFCEFLVVIVTLLLSAGYAAVVLQTDPLWVRLVFIGVTLAVNLPATINYFKYWPSAIENSLSYEKSLVKPTKLKK